MMKETITLSYSQIANQLVTHFNNLQDDRFHENPDSITNLAHILPKATKGSKFISNLYPRSILFDYSNGTGALDPFIYFQENPMNSIDMKDVQTIQTTPTLDLNHYQNNLNKGKPTVGLDNERTQFWSDFAKVTYKPTCVIKHPSYVYDPETSKGVDKNTHSQKFDGHQLGVDTFQDIEAFHDSIDDQVRKMFEESNNVNAVNAVVELDSAWSGVCFESLKHLIDDQLGGKGSKVMLWSLKRDYKYVREMTITGKLDRIQKLTDLGNLDVGGIASLNLDFPSTLPIVNTWAKTSVLSIPFDFFNNIKDVDIGEVLYKLTDGGQQKFINDVRTLWNDEVLHLGGGLFTNKPDEDAYTFAKSVVTSQSCIEDIKGFEDFDALVAKSTPRLYLQTYKSRHDIKYTDSMPSFFQNADIPACSLGVTSSLRGDFKTMHDFVSKYCRSDVREELKNDLENLVESYTHGFEYTDGEDEDDVY